MNYKIVTDGLVARWDSEDWSSGTSWVDRVAGKKLTLSSAPASKTDDGVELTTSITFASESLSALSLSQPCTFEWLGRIDGTFSSSSPAHVFGLSSSSGSWAGICCYAKTSNGIQLDIGSSGTIASSVSTAGIEYHIIVTVSNNTTTLYVNSTTAKGTTTKSSGYASKTYLYNNEGSGRFYGAIRRMCLWNKCLSASEIATLFEEEVTTTYTVNTSATGEGVINPDGETTVSEGGAFNMTITPTDGAEVRATDNGVDVTDSLVRKSVETEKTAVIASYSTSGTITGTKYQSAVGNGSDTSQSTTGNDYASTSGSTAYIEYAFDLSDIPSDATIESVQCTVKGHLESTSSSSEVANLQLYSGSTAKGSVSKFSSTSDAVVTLTTGEWTRSELDDLRLRFTIGYYGGLVQGATIVVKYSTSGGATHYYTYGISSVNEDHDIVIVFGASGTGCYLKVGGVWYEASAIYEKRNGSWVSIVSSEIDRTKHYKKG